ncbi:hypothetical protein IKR20_05360 [bacterium]|nr:hypothetical protein [bacterium]
MKFIYVSCNISKLEQLTEEIKGLGIKTFQIVENTAGSFENGNPRMNTSVWPGTNAVVFLQVTPEKCSEFLNTIRRMNTEIVNENERILAASWECENYVYSDEKKEE